MEEQGKNQSEERTGVNEKERVARWCVDFLALPLMGLLWFFSYQLCRYLDSSWVGLVAGFALVVVCVNAAIAATTLALVLQVGWKAWSFVWFKFKSMVLFRRPKREFDLEVSVWPVLLAVLVSVVFVCCCTAVVMTYLGEPTQSGWVMALALSSLHVVAVPIFLAITK